MANSHTDKID